MNFGSLRTILLIVFMLSSILKVNGTHDSLGVDELTLFARENLNSTIQYLESKRSKYKSEKNYIEWIFYRVHRKQLKRYKQYSSLEETIDKGYYDCVTGTALYAGIYNALGFDVYIKESTYHVYLIIKSDEGDVLIESTDPLNGVVADSEMINGWENIYTIQYALSDDIDRQFNFKKVSKEGISNNQLLGLLYFNQAVRFYNNKRFTDSMGYIEAGIKYYPSDRMYTMAGLIAQAMLDCDKVNPVIGKIYAEKYLASKLEVAGN